jgi:hypothetical protein
VTLAKLDAGLFESVKSYRDTISELSSISTQALIGSTWGGLPDTVGTTNRQRDNTSEPAVRELEKRVDSNEQKATARQAEMNAAVDSVRAEVAALRQQVDDTRKNLTKDVKESERLTEAYQKEVKKAEEHVANSERRSIELVGLVSSIIALILASATSALSERHPLSVYLTILMLAASLMLFGCMLHAFFEPDARRQKNTYWTPFFIVPLAIIILVGIALVVLTICGWFGAASYHPRVTLPWYHAVVVSQQDVVAPIHRGVITCLRLSGRALSAPYGA